MLLRKDGLFVGGIATDSSDCVLGQQGIGMIHMLLMAVPMHACGLTYLYACTCTGSSILFNENGELHFENLVLTSKEGNECVIRVKAEPVSGEQQLVGSSRSVGDNIGICYR